MSRINGAFIKEIMADVASAYADDQKLSIDEVTLLVAKILRRALGL